MSTGHEIKSRNKKNVEPYVYWNLKSNFVEIQKSKTQHKSLLI